MSSDSDESYSELVEKYAGYWVLKKNNKVIFADKDFSIVMKKGDELNLSPEESEVAFIESGDAVFY